MLLQQEFRRVQAAPAAPDMDSFSLKANPVTREVVAVMEIEDGAVLEMVIKLPASSPLKRAEVACRRRVSHMQGFKWLWTYLRKFNVKCGHGCMLSRSNILDLACCLMV